MPSLGADMSAGTLVAWRVKVGDRVKRGDIVAEVETEKGLIEIEIFSDGTITELVVEEGTKVPVGTVLARVGDMAGAPAETSADGETMIQGAHTRLDERPSTPSARRAARERDVDLKSARGSGSHGRVQLDDVREPEKREAPASSGSRLKVTPIARRRAEELGVDLRSVSGTGRDGAILLADVERVRPATDPKAQMRAAVGAAMSRSKREIPHYYLTHDIDFHAAREWLANRNEGRPPDERIVAATLLVKGVALALRKVPELNATWDGTTAQPNTRVSVGLAVSLRGGGLVAPGIDDADTQSLESIMTAIDDLVSRARRGKLRASEMSNATITLTSLGERGVDVVVPVILPPQVAIVGFGAMRERPAVVEGAVVARPIITASLAADHRVTDGHRGARFLSQVAKLLQKPEAL